MEASQGSTTAPGIGRHPDDPQARAWGPLVTLSRKTPLKRTRFKKKPARRIAERQADAPFRDWLHREEHCVCAEAFASNNFGCYGSIEQSHAGAMGMGMKAPEAESWAFCHNHHMEWEEHRGMFKGWSKLARREFSKAMSEATQARWRYYLNSQQPSGNSGQGEPATTSIHVVGSLKHPPAAETYVCTHCGDVDVGSPCRSCGGATEKMRITDYLDMIVPF